MYMSSTIISGHSRDYFIYFPAWKFFLLGNSMFQTSRNSANNNPIYIPVEAQDRESHCVNFPLDFSLST